MSSCRDACGMKNFKGRPCTHSFVDVPVLTPIRKCVLLCSRIILRKAANLHTGIMRVTPRGFLTNRSNRTVGNRTPRATWICSMSSSVWGASHGGACIQPGRTMNERSCGCSFRRDTYLRCHTGVRSKRWNEVEYFYLLTGLSTGVSHPCDESQNNKMRTRSDPGASMHLTVPAASPTDLYLHGACACCG